MSETQPQVLVIKQMFDESQDAFELRVKQAHQHVTEETGTDQQPLIIYSVPLPVAHSEATRAFA